MSAIASNRSHLLKKLLIALAVALALVTLPLYAWKVQIKEGYTDFDVYYRAASRVHAGAWEQLYNLSDGTSPFRYAPILLPFFRPLAWLEHPAARMLWFYLQYLWFALGFYFIYRSLRVITRGSDYGSQPAVWLTATTFLFVLRFCLDCLTIGQVSSLIFMALSAAMYSWIRRAPGLTGAALALPAALKIGPGFIYFLFASARPWERKRGLGRAVLLTALWIAATGFWVGGYTRYLLLWRDWFQIVRMDSQYYDSSHYGSQSINSALLRWVKAGVISPEAASHFYVLAAGLICGAMVLFWMFRRPRDSYGRGLFFALGVFPYLWIMPETFKYSLTVLAFPIALLLLRATSNAWTMLSLLFSALVLSLAGKDLVGDTLFFQSQLHSLPLAATLLLGAATWRLAFQYSQPSYFLERVNTILPLRGLGPWSVSPEKASLEFSLLLPLPFHSDLETRAGWLTSLVAGMHASGQTSQKVRFEILLIPFGSRITDAHPLMVEARELSRLHPATIRILPAAVIPGRAAALRQGFLLSRGEVILATHLDQPAAAEFFQAALDWIRQGDELVRANRRLPESRFEIPVRLLSLIYGRHRLGLVFNRLVRAILPVDTTDTHSGSWAMSRRLATQVFALQTSADFLFDLELAITARAHGVTERDLPAVFWLREEKRVSRMGQETLAILFGLPLLRYRYWRRRYHPWTAPHSRAALAGVTADDWGLTPGVNDGILELARRGIVKRVSMMAHSRYLQHGLQELQELAGGMAIEVGLHFDLTYDRQSPVKVLLDWLISWGEKRVALRKSVRAELDQQLARLKEVGVHVHYLDGHHHIHLIPGILPALAPVLKQAEIRSVRLPYDPALWFSAKAPLCLLSLLARPFLRRNGFGSAPCLYPNAGFFLDHGRLRAGLLSHPSNEVIVHPALTADLVKYQIADPYNEGRHTEYQALRMLDSVWIARAALTPSPLAPEGP